MLQYLKSDHNLKSFEEDLTFLDAVNHQLTELVTETLYFLFILFCVDMTFFGDVELKAVSLTQNNNVSNKSKGL